MIPRRPGEIAHAIRFAKSHVGDPYLWGGTGAGGFDCSGIVWAAYRKAGYSGIGRTTYEQIKQGIAVDPRNLRPGDIVFPSTHHEGLYIGHGLVLSAPHTGANVHVTSLGNFAPGGLVAARRLLAGGGGVIPPRAIGGQTDNGLPVAHPDPQMRLPSIHAVSRALQTLTKITPQATQLQQTYPGTQGSPGPTPPQPTITSPQNAIATLQRLHDSLTPQANLAVPHPPKAPAPWPAP